MHCLTSDSHRPVYFNQPERLSRKPVLAIQSVVSGEVTRGGAASQTSSVDTGCIVHVMAKNIQL